MPRTTKCRRVCAEPINRIFAASYDKEPVVLQVEEFESIRLIDLEQLDQSVAANTMQVSRGTLQRILYTARSKVAEALVNGRSIVIEGGNYEVPNKRCQEHKVCQCCRFTK